MAASRGVQGKAQQRKPHRRLRHVAPAGWRATRHVVRCAGVQVAPSGCVAPTNGASRRQDGSRAREQPRQGTTGRLARCRRRQRRSAGCTSARASGCSATCNRRRAAVVTRRASPSGHRLFGHCTASPTANAAWTGGHEALGPPCGVPRSVRASAAVPRVAFGACTASGSPRTGCYVGRRARAPWSTSLARDASGPRARSRRSKAGRRRQPWRRHQTALPHRTTPASPQQTRACPRRFFSPLLRVRRRHGMPRTGSRAAHAPRAPAVPARLVQQRARCGCFARRPSRAEQLAADAALLRGAALGHVETVLAAAAAGASFQAADKARLVEPRRYSRYSPGGSQLTHRARTAGRHRHA